MRLPQVGGRCSGVAAPVVLAMGACAPPSGTIDAVRQRTRALVQISDEPRAGEVRECL